MIPLVMGPQLIVGSLLLPNLFVPLALELYLVCLCRKAFRLMLSVRVALHEKRPRPGECR